MAFRHNSQVSDKEPDWGSIDKSKLPRIAFADQGEPEVKSTWRYPHHWVENLPDPPSRMAGQAGGGDLDENGVHTTGTLLLHKGGLNAARAAAMGARTGQRETKQEVTAHLRSHREALGLEGAENQALAAQLIVNAEIPADVPEWVMIARTGLWRGHPKVGTEIITEAHLRSALDYFDRHYAAHGADLVIDYHHASAYVPLGAERAPAAGWVQQMELRADGAELWGRAQWTTVATNAIGAREFRYLSPVLRFNAPDRVTGQPVLLQIHSVALTNTPFLTELESLNEAAATDGGGQYQTPVGGGESMTLIEALAKALEEQPEQTASRLGLQSVEDEPATQLADKDVAEAIVANAARVKELEARPAAPQFVANALDLPADADETEVRAAIIRLRAPGAGLCAVRARLGLTEDAAETDILNAIGALQETRRKTEAEELVDDAVKAGKIPPAHRQFFLREATNDLEAAREVINSMPVLTLPQHEPALRRAGTRQLSDSEQAVCRQLGLSAEAFVNAAD